jgi:hypothetical protein
MLHLGYAGNNAVDGFKELHILPVSISHQYDPCDVLKAKELYLQSIGQTYSKTPADDLLSMKYGLIGLKGNICYGFGDEIDFSQFGDITDIATITKVIAQEIDSQIYKNYKLFPSHYISYDLFYDTERFYDFYNEHEKAEFLNLINKKIAELLPEFLNNADFQKQVFRQYANILSNVYEERELE